MPGTASSEFVPRARFGHHSSLVIRHSCVLGYFVLRYFPRGVADDVMLCIAQGKR
jgi:hypothetical protein